LILDTKGVEQAAAAAVVTLPRPNARFIKNSVEPVNIRFAWNTQNIDQKIPLRLEIASGPNFTRIVRTTEGVDSSNVALGAGTWYWRLSYQNTVLSSGQFTIVDAVISAPTSPIYENISYQENMPIRFEWQPIEGASYYILEAGLTPDMIYPSITRQTAIASYVESNMEMGNWYWHVKPVFSSLYEGATVFSQVSSFRIEKIDEPVVAAQTVNETPEMPAQPEQETKSAVASKTAKPEVDKSDKLANPAPSASNAATSVGSISNPDEIISSAAGWDAYKDDRSRSNISIAKEIIDGKEKEVLTININLASGSKNNNWAGASTTNIDVIQILRKANGVRFKVLGDGKKWNANFVTSDVTDYAYHIAAISTKKGEVSNIDISFNRLRQPDWKTRNVRFNKNNITDFAIERNINNDAGSGPGASTIKIFDFEIY